MKCRVCRSKEAEWAWQPWGPGKENDTFTLPGSHYRGFPIVKICTDCKERIQKGAAVTVIYKGNTMRVNG